MADYTIIKLSNLSPMHIGTGRESYDFSASTLHSDTLTSALAAIKAQKGESSDLKGFLNSFKLSSAYPFYEDTLFLPTPLGKLNVRVNSMEEHLYRKALKKVRYAAVHIWQEIAKGECVELDYSQINGEFISDRPIQISQSYVNERVSISRSGQEDSDPFFFEWNYYSQCAGLYVLTDAQGEELEDLVCLFKILGQQGIGTDKSVGGGKFDVEVSKNKLHFDKMSDANASLLLSLYIPLESELASIDLEKSTYNLVLRGGFIAGSQEDRFRHLKKKSIYMMDTGSVLVTTNALEGKVVDLRPNWNDEALHPVYRSGRAISIPIRIIGHE